jgi:hypothetical protein
VSDFLIPTSSLVGIMLIDTIETGGVESEEVLIGYTMKAAGSIAERSVTGST